MDYTFDKVIELQKDGANVETIMVIENPDGLTQVVTTYAAKMESLAEEARPRLEAAKLAWEAPQETCGAEMPVDGAPLSRRRRGSAPAAPVEPEPAA